ncbi:MAG: hypothetical protein AB7G13_29850 [Lautropia sp.]
MNPHHPAVESVVLPLALALLVTGLARRSFGPWRGGLAAALGVGTALVAATFWMVGAPQTPAGTLSKLPYVYVAAAIAGVVVGVVVGARSGAAATPAARPAVVAWLCGALVSVLALGWLGGIRGAVHGAIGAMLLAALLRAPAGRADAAAALVIAALGLAAATLAAGSLTLFQHALLIAAAAGGAALWLWPRARLAFGPAAVVTATIAWLATAQAATRLVGLAEPVLALLAAALLAPLVTARRGSGGVRDGPRDDAGGDRRDRTTLTAPLLSAAIALVFVAAAVGWQISGPGGASGNDDGSATSDDAYLD